MSDFTDLKNVEVYLQTQGNTLKHSKWEILPFLEVKIQKSCS